MGLSIRQKINRSKLSGNERLLRKAGIVQATVQGQNSVLTEDGRKVVLDILWEDDELRAKVLALVQQVKDTDKEDGDCDD